MKLWKRDTKNWTVRQVEGDPWPGSDSEGDKCYVNTHFDNEAEAWEQLHAEAKAWLSLSVRSLNDARATVTKYEKESADAAVALAGVMKSMPSNVEVSGAAK